MCRPHSVMRLSTKYSWTFVNRISLIISFSISSKFPLNEWASDFTVNHSRLCWLVSPKIWKRNRTKTSLTRQNKWSVKVLWHLFALYDIFPAHSVDTKVYPQKDSVRKRKEDPGVLIQVADFLFAFFNSLSNHLNHGRPSLKLFQLRAVWRLPFSFWRIAHGIYNSHRSSATVMRVAVCLRIILGFQSTIFKVVCFTTNWYCNTHLKKQLINVQISSILPHMELGHFSGDLVLLSAVTWSIISPTIPANNESNNSSIRKVQHDQTL